jgi:Photosynthesis affected mutant 68
MAADRPSSDPASEKPAAVAGDRQRLPFEPKAKASKPKDSGDQAALSAAKSSRSADSSKPHKSKSGKSTAEKATQAKAEKFETIRQAARDARESRKSTKPAKIPTLAESRIPDAIGKRMLSRVLVFSGIPTFTGVLVFFISYYVVVNDLYDLPNVVVLLSSLLGFGLGVVGLSYGVLSASWEEDEPGSALGFAEFGINAKRLVAALKEFRTDKRSS